MDSFELMIEENTDYDYEYEEEQVDDAKFPEFLEIRINNEKFLSLSRDIIKNSSLVRMLVRNGQLNEYIEIPFISEKWMNQITNARDFLNDILNGKKYDKIFEKKNPNYNIFMILKCLESYLILDNYFFEKFENNWKYKMFITQIERNKDFSDFFARKNNKKNKKQKK